MEVSRLDASDGNEYRGSVMVDLKLDDGGVSHH